MKNTIPRFCQIVKIEEENSNIKTFYIKVGSEDNFLPGQFVMLWIQGVDQKPFSISGFDGETIALTVFKRGALTEKLFTFKVGDKVGITGPFGTFFSQNENTHYLLVAGGYGAAPLYFLASSLAKTNSTIDFFLGARTVEQLLFIDKIKSLTKTNLFIATDDGSEGAKGFVTDEFLKQLQKIENKENVLVCVCGPELMEKKVLDICNAEKVSAEISIERYMKCGFGVCGQCAVDPLGICMCKNGPVVKKELANQITEFGVYHRDKSGTKIYFNQ